MTYKFSPNPKSIWAVRLHGNWYITQPRKASEFTMRPYDVQTTDLVWVGRDGDWICVCGQEEQRILLESPERTR